MKANQDAIRDFLSIKRIAIAGVSRDEKKFGHAVFKELRERGFDTLPVNPHAESFNGIPSYADVLSLPSDVDRLLVVTPKKDTESVVKQALEKGIRKIWIQQMSDTKESLDLLKANGIEPIRSQCILMWAEPVKSIHKFHRAFKKFFGQL